MSTIAQGQVLGPIMLNIFINFRMKRQSIPLKYLIMLQDREGKITCQRAVQPSRPRKVGEVI